MSAAVVLRCHGCRKVLARVEAVAREDWSEVHYVARCSRCDMPDPGRVVGYLIRRGIEGAAIGGEMPLWAIREELRRAEREGREVGVSVRFSEQDDGLHLHLK